MNTSKDLTIASLVLGGVGALLFIIYKVRGGKKSSLMANGSKLPHCYRYHLIGNSRAAS